MSLESKTSQSTRESRASSKKKKTPKHQFDHKGVYMHEKCYQVEIVLSAICLCRLFVSHSRVILVLLAEIKIAFGLVNNYL